jgi:hypothetical protein
VVVAYSVVTGYAVMILSSFFNIYYAILFFIVGAVYTYKIMKKSQIQLQLDNNFAAKSSSGGSEGDRGYEGMTEWEKQRFKMKHNK